MPRFVVMLACSVLPAALVPGVGHSGTLAGGYYLHDRILEPQIVDPSGLHLPAYDVSISDGVALVGAPELLAFDNGFGHAYLYNSYTGALLHTLTSNSDVDPSFGRAVALDDGYAVVSATFATYVYDADSATLLHILPGSISVDIDNGRVILASRNEGASVFDLASGSQLSTINSRATDVALSGDYAIVTDITYVHSDAKPGSGSAIVFDWKSGEQLYDLTPGGIPAGAGFGISVAADGHIVAVGAVKDPVPRSGRAYLFDLSTGESLFRIDGPTGILLTDFGSFVAVRGDMIFVAAPSQSVDFPLDASVGTSRDSNHGTVYAFSVETGKEAARFTVPLMSAGGNERYGFSIDYDGHQLIAGTLGWPKNAYITDFPIPEPSTANLLSFAALALLVPCQKRCGMSQRLRMKIKRNAVGQSLDPSCDSQQQFT